MKVLEISYKSYGLLFSNSPKKKSRCDPSRAQKPWPRKNCGRWHFQNLDILWWISFQRIVSMIVPSLNRPLLIEWAIQRWIWCNNRPEIIVFDHVLKIDLMVCLCIFKGFYDQQICFSTFFSCKEPVACNKCDENIIGDHVEVLHNISYFHYFTNMQLWLTYGVVLLCQCSLYHW